jgi:hypothetical protein
MAELRDIASRIRSKNAGPFWITIDIFCDGPDVLARVATALPAQRVADHLQLDASRLKRFEMPALNVLKFSFPRPHPQGSLRDRDMHGAQVAVLVESLEV